MDVADRVFAHLAFIQHLIDIASARLVGTCEPVGVGLSRDNLRKAELIEQSHIAVDHDQNIQRSTHGLN